MNSRERDYQNINMSRVSKNEELYKTINDTDLGNYSVRSNAKVIGNQEQEIDIEKLKKILDNNYNKVPQRRSIKIEARKEEQEVKEPTKEYDLNTVINKAKEQKGESYEEDRAKKLRNTQYDILNNLDIKEEKTEEKEPTPAEENLMDLINTITINEAKNQDEEDSDDPLDLLSDLKGSENTQVYESMSETISSVEIKEKDEEENKEEVNEKSEVKNSIEEVKDKETKEEEFYTTHTFKPKDFKDEDEDDFVDEVKLSPGIKILIVVVVLAFAIGLFLFLKTFIDK